MTDKFLGVPTELSASHKTETQMMNDDDKAKHGEFVQQRVPPRADWRQNWEFQESLTRTSETSTATNMNDPVVVVVMEPGEKMLLDAQVSVGTKYLPIAPCSGTMGGETMRLNAQVSVVRSPPEEASLFSSLPAVDHGEPLLPYADGNSGSLCGTWEPIRPPGLEHAKVKEDGELELNIQLTIPKELLAPIARLPQSDMPTSVPQEQRDAVNLDVGHLTENDEGDDAGDDRADFLSTIDSDDDYQNENSDKWSDVQEMDLCPLPLLMEVNRISVADPQKDGWVRMEEDMTLDSGASHSINRGVKYTPNWKLTPSEASKRGVQYIGPGGELIPNKGERCGKMMFENGIIANARLQEGEVRRPLLAVSQVEYQGNVTFFPSKWPIVTPMSDPAVQKMLELLPQIKTGIKVHRVNNTYRIPCWIQEGGGDADAETKSVFSRQPHR